MKRPRTMTEAFAMTRECAKYCEPDDRVMYDRCEKCPHCTVIRDCNSFDDVYRCRLGITVV